MAAPPIDERTPAQVARQVQDLSKLLTDQWPRFDPGKGVAASLIGVFSRFTDIVIRRLNRVPDKNFLAFLDLLGASPLPPQPARAPLTFSLAVGSTSDAVVPAGTQVAAPPAEGESEEVVFETERELVVTAAQLASLFVRDPLRDGYADRGPAISEAQPSGAPAFEGERAIEHAFYVSHSTLFGYDNPREVSVDFTLDAPPVGAEPARVRWEMWDGVLGVPLTPVGDTTNGLRAGGRVTFGGVGPFPTLKVRGVEGRWLCCRLLTPVTRGAEKRQGMVRAEVLPRVTSFSINTSLTRKGLPVEAAFANSVGLDTSKSFFPFGERPKYGDVFYLANADAFSKPAATVTLDVTVANPSTAGADSPIPPAKASDKLVLEWEYWDGGGWKSLGQAKPQAGTGFDSTLAFTATGKVVINLPANVRSTNVNGVENVWLRVRIAAGNYGEESRYELKDPLDPSKGYERDEKGSYILLPETFAPPLIGSLAVGYEFGISASPEAVITCNDFACEEFTGGSFFRPFAPTGDEDPTLYLGFTLPPGRATFPNSKLSLYAGVADHMEGEITAPFSPRRSLKHGLPGSTVKHEFLITPGAPTGAAPPLVLTGTRWLTASNVVAQAGAQTAAGEISVVIPPDAVAGQTDQGWMSMSDTPEADGAQAASFVTAVSEAGSAGGRVRLAWEYWNGESWSHLGVRDETENLTVPGLVEFLAPADLSRRREFGVERYWLRVRRHSGQYKFEPRLRRVLLNTVTASQTLTVRDEVLGSSDASANQTFRTTRAPVLLGQQLEVREPEPPSAEEREKIIREEGEGALRPVGDEGENSQEVWVRWHEMTDFYGSGPGERHYVLDHLTGEVRFGDGVNGRVPPLGTGNVRVAVYRTGGGSVGNRPAGTVTQLKTTVPYVDKAFNTEAASGGSDAETLDSFVERMPRSIRHGGRAVTPQDYEDLAKLASPEVARAKCVPLRDLAADPDAALTKPGTVSLIVVPRTDGAQPLPSTRLVEGVREYIGARRLPVGELVVVGPEYVRVDVETVVSLKSLESAGEVEAEIRDALSRFLHPLTGGPGGQGWDFGRKPRKSDFYALLEPVEGVSYIETLNINYAEDRPGVELMNRFLVYSGRHQIGLIFEGA